MVLNMLTFEQIKAIETALGPEAAKPVVEAFASTDQRVFSAILTELATKADYAELRGMVSGMATKEDLAKLRGDMETRFARLEVLVKVLIGLTALAVAFFSPVAKELLLLIP